MPGWKFSQYEMKSVPIRLEFRPKDIENNQVVLVIRDGCGKEVVSLNELGEKLHAYYRIYIKIYLILPYKTEKREHT